MSQNILPNGAANRNSQSGRGQPHSKTFGIADMHPKSLALWSAAVLCRFGFWHGENIARRSRRLLALSAVFACTAFGLLSLAQNLSNPPASDELPRLAPPRGEIPPTFWEQYGVWVIFGGLLLVSLL